MAIVIVSTKTEYLLKVEYYISFKYSFNQGLQPVSNPSSNPN